MAKTNFTKVEEALDQGLRKYSVESLLQAAGPGQKLRNPTIAYSEEKPQTLSKQQTLLVRELQRDLRRFEKKSSKELGFSKKELKKLLENPLALTPENWETLQQAKEKLEGYKAQLAKEPPKQSDEAIVESERKDHINRRYNVNKKWLPLT